MGLGSEKKGGVWFGLLFVVEGLSKLCFTMVSGEWAVLGLMGWRWVGLLGLVVCFVFREYRKGG